MQQAKPPETKVMIVTFVSRRSNKKPRYIVAGFNNQNNKT